MKRYIAFLSILLLGCSASPIVPAESPADAQTLKSHLGEIISETEFRNFRNIKELNRVAAYIRQNIEKHGYRCAYQTYSIKDNEYKNVVCRLDLGFNEIVVVGAHYDVCEDQPGADDNGSGVAGLLELARIVSAQRSQLKHNLELVAYTLEEPPFFATKQMGSYVHAKSMKDAGAELLGMISLEMIGYFTEDKIQEFPPVIGAFYPDEANFIAAVSNWSSRRISKAFKNAIEAVPGLSVETLVAPSIITGVDFSDHRNYWQFDYEAIVVTDTAFFRNKNYHEVTDTIDTLDFEKMAKVVDGVAALLLSGHLQTN